MSDVNVVVMTGRLTRPAEFKAGGNGGAVVTFSIANNQREYNPKSKQAENVAYFFNCRWLFSDAERAQKIVQNLTQGSNVSVTGSIRYNEFQDNEGVRKQYYNIMVSDLNFLGSGQKKDDSNGRQGNGQYGGKSQNGGYQKKNSGYQQNGGNRNGYQQKGQNSGQMNQDDADEWGNDPMPNDF